MSFRDFNDHRPGTYEWDYVLGKNTTGQFPDEEHYIIFGNTITDAVFSYAGGENWQIFECGSWSLQIMEKQTDGSLVLSFDGLKYRATVVKGLKVKNGIVVDLEDL